MKCPRDQGTLSLRTIEGHSGYRCPSCHGGWLPAKFVRAIEYSGDFKYAAYTEAVAKGVSHVTRLACPSGCGALSATRYADITISWCPSCQGSWFDFGSISELLRKFTRHDGTVGKAIVADAALSTLIGILSALFP